jgi:hypothetical protein
VHGVEADPRHRAGLDAVAVDGQIFPEHARSSGCRRAQSQRFVQHSYGMAEPRYVIGGKRPVAESADLVEDSVLDFGVAPERPQ